MRLSEGQKTVIKSAIHRFFGKDTHIILFGSRADDSARGGDIDLLIETNLNADQAIQAKLDALICIQKALGEQKIDLVIKRTEATELLPVHQLARETGISL